jgi:hypothetical protein
VKAAWRSTRVLAAAASLAGWSVSSSFSGDLLLVDATLEVGLVGGHQPHAPGYFLLDEWVSGGMAVGDFDRNGWPDLFVLGGGGVPDQLFMNDGDGTFTDRAAEWGVASQHCGGSAAVLDFDGDGWLDIHLTSSGFQNDDQGRTGKHRLYRNTGEGSFEDVAFFTGVRFGSFIFPNPSGIAVGDYDLDGDLDLFVSAWRSAANGNRLYTNLSDGTFLDRIVPAGLHQSGVWWFQGRFADTNGDLHPELLVSGDFGTSRCFVNQRDGTFLDRTEVVGAGLDENGMGQALGDFDRNGQLDWYVTSIFNDSPSKGFRNGNQLYMGTDDMVFSEEGVARGVEDGGWGWGAIAIDLDLDGWEDLVEVNGRASAQWIGEPGKVFRNLGGGVFEEIALACGFDGTGDDRSVVWLDADRDGDADLVVQENNGPLRYYRNDAASGHWLQIEFDTSTHPHLAPDGFGTRVVVRHGGVEWVRVMDGGPSYLATSEPVVHFGLGDVDLIEEVEVRWARGMVTLLHDVPADQRLTLVAPRLGDLDADGSVGPIDLSMLLGSWGESDSVSATMADLDLDGTIGPGDLATLLSHWKR